MVRNELQHFLRHFYLAMSIFLGAHFSSELLVVIILSPLAIELATAVVLQLGE